MEAIRPAGLSERRCIARENIGIYGSIIATGVYESSLKQELSQDDYVKVLKACVAEHPTLSTIIQDAETEQPQLARVAELDLRDHVQLLNPTGDEGDAAAFLEKAQNERWPSHTARPHWRVYIQPLPASPEAASRFRATFSCSHALTDGTSCFCFHKAFLRAVQDLPTLAFDAEPIWQPPVNQNTILPLEKASALPISWSFLLKPLLNAYLPASLAKAIGMGAERNDNAWTGAAARPPLPAQGQLIPTAVRLTRVPAELVPRLLAACKAHDAKLTALLNHLTAQSLARSLRARANASSPALAFQVDTPLDLRRNLPATYAGAMANMASVTQETIAPDPDPDTDAPPVWASISASSATLARASSTLSDQPIGLLRYLSNMHDWTRTVASTPASSAFETSNPGVFDGSTSASAPAPAAPHWVVADMAFSQSANAVGAAFNANVASARGGPLNVVFTWWPGMLGLEKAEDEGRLMEEVCEDLKRRLEQCC